MKKLEGILGKKNILVAEPDKFTRNVLAMFFKINGYDLTHIDYASDGIEALAAAKNKDYNLILMAASMPGQTGTEVASSLRQMDKYARTPIISMSTGVEPEREGSNAFTDYVQKPFGFGKIEKLAEVIESYLKGEPK